MSLLKYEIINLAYISYSLVSSSALRLYYRLSFYLYIVGEVDLMVKSYCYSFVMHILVFYGLSRRRNNSLILIDY